LLKLPIKNACWPPRFQVNTKFTRSAYFVCTCCGDMTGEGCSAALFSERLIRLPKIELVSDSECEKSLPKLALYEFTISCQFWWSWVTALNQNS
jgi:hypothetical protein